jgi:putative hydrolase of the HAD superfamily
MEKKRGLPKDFVRSVNARNPNDNAWAKFERAECNAAEFDALFAAEARALGHELDGASVIACLSGDIRPAMVNALDVLKSKGFALGCITNNVPFDHIIESSKAGMRKPDPRIYAMMCKALAAVPSQCIYLDDLGINCKPAAAMGMAAIKVTSGEQALQDLGTLLALTFTPLGVYA